MHVVVRILALLQRKTLIETKNRTLKRLKWRYSTVRSMKNRALLMEDGAFAVFFRPHPREFAIQGKKCQCPGVSPGGRGAGRRWNWLIRFVPLLVHGLEIRRLGSWNTLPRRRSGIFFLLVVFFPRHLFIFVVRMQCISVDFTSCGFSSCGLLLIKEECRIRFVRL